MGLIQNKIKYFLEAEYNTPLDIDSDINVEMFVSMPYFGNQSEKNEIWIMQFTETMFSIYQIQYYSCISQHIRKYF